MGIAINFSEIISLESRGKLLTLTFFRKKGKDISSQIFLEFAFTCTKLNTLINILNYMVNGNIKNNSWYLLNSKIVATALLVSLDSSLLAWPKYSLHSFSSQPKFIHVLNRLATSIS